MVLENKVFDEERALYGSKDLKLINCRFQGEKDGESALKECDGVTAQDCYFDLRYPFWHTSNAKISDCEMTPLCRAALWYNNNIEIIRTKMNGIKALREGNNITLENCEINSPEFLWKCGDIKIKDTKIVSEYPFFECKDINITGLDLKGKYSFQYINNMEIHNSVFDTKDAFWHSRNVTVYDSVIKGEYLGWYSENLRLVRCKIIGTQPLCYCKNLVLENCTMENTDLCFERSDVEAVIDSAVDSIKNPTSGHIRAKAIGEIILEKEYVDPKNTDIIIV